jgi:molybdopterin-binding protein
MATVSTTAMQEKTTTTTAADQMELKEESETLAFTKNFGTVNPIRMPL